jgi:MATE family multidrug resistance protein
MSDQKDLVSEYFMIRILAAPATMALYVLLGWFFGMQNALYPLIITVLVNVLNLVLSYVLVMNFDMGISGVAYGTVAAQYFGVIIGVGLILYRYRSKIHIEWFEICSQWAEWMAILKVNSNLFIRTVSLTFVFGFFYAKSSASGEMVLAANVILLQFLNWMSYGIDGFAYASESLVGKYFGAKSTSNLSRTIKLSFAWGGGLALLYSVVFLVFGSSIIRIFTDDSAIFDYTFDRLWWIAVLPIIAFACYIWDGIYIGLTAARQMRDTMLISVLVYLGTYFALSLYDKEVIWWSLAIFLFFRGFIQSIYWMAEKELKTVRDSISKGVIY